MPKPISAAKRASAVKLRVETDLSTPAIARHVGISNFSAYRILRRHPWKGRRRCKNDWTAAEIEALIELWPTASEGRIRAALPRRNFGSIGKKASSLRLRRPHPSFRRDGRNAHPVVARLEKIRRSCDFKRTAISKRSGIHVNQLCLWAMGRRMPKFDKVCLWAEAMGYEIAVRKKV